jgi:NAD(P)-dependent dehydrogenase (short-subunit alcohol dehydrogenase family)
MVPLEKARLRINMERRSVFRLSSAIVRDNILTFSEIVVITGPSESSLGAEAAITLAAAKPKHIVLAGRTKSKIDPVIGAIKEIDSSIEVSFVTLDLLSNASVREAASNIKELVPHIDVLINSAGVMARKHYETSADGVEKQFAANHLGHFLLTNLILDKIVPVKGTIVNVTSMAYFIAEVNTEDPNFEVRLPCYAYIKF